MWKDYDPRLKKLYCAILYESNGQSTEEKRTENMLEADRLMEELTLELRKDK